MRIKVATLKKGYLLTIDELRVFFDPEVGDEELKQADWLIFTGSKAKQALVERKISEILSVCVDAEVLLPPCWRSDLETITDKSQNIHTFSDPHQIEFKCTNQLSVFPIFNASKCKRDQRDLAGYVIRFLDNQWLMLGAEIVVNPDLLEKLVSFGKIHSATLSVVARNGLVDNEAIECKGLTPHEAFALVDHLRISQVVIRPVNPVSAGEVRLIHNQLGSNSRLLVDPNVFYLGSPKASVVIRTLNEARYLGDLLSGIRQQRTTDLDCEIVIVDSGSTDGTLQIAEKHGCTILHITREQFSFGRSLNIGCEAAQGEMLVITSGHCVPASPDWLHNLCRPLVDEIAQYSYGKQLGGPSSYFSECRVFEKYFPHSSRLPQDGFYCNNANAALLKSVWMKYRFDEELTGLEDMALAQRLVKDGGKVAYVAEAPVYHHHSETWPQVRRRFEREAIALQQIMPNIHVGWFDTVRYTLNSIYGDWRRAGESKQLMGNITSIIKYRFNQYTGSYRGHQQHRKLSQTEKDQYFYPN
jgi:glycosyltransferase involved in cell wall biosynthesis